MKKGVCRSIGWIALSLVILGCSSAPKRPLEVFTIRNQAEKQLDLVNETADQGRYGDALILLEEARRLAVSVDDPPLLIKTGLAQGNIAFAIGSIWEAFDAWNKALEEAKSSGDSALGAVCRIYLARGQLFLLSRGRGAEIPNASLLTYQSIRNQVLQDIAAVPSDEITVALGWTVIGLAEKAENHYEEAKRALEKAYDLHMQGRYLTGAAYDRYLIASVHSVAGNLGAAIEVLKEALDLDRRAENGAGLAADWDALGKVYDKAGREAEAQAAKERARAILRAIGQGEGEESPEEVNSGRNG